MRLLLFSVGKNADLLKCGFLYTILVFNSRAACIQGRAFI